jgi:hypothetical protein
VANSIDEITNRFQKVPGSAMLIRYIQSSYQDDPVRSAIELILVIFFIRYLLAPSWTPEPLVVLQTVFEKEEAY